MKDIDIGKEKSEELNVMVEKIIQQLQGKFENMSTELIGKIDDMGNRVHELEKSITNLIHQTEDIDLVEINSKNQNTLKSGLLQENAQSSRNSVEDQESKVKDEFEVCQQFDGMVKNDDTDAEAQDQAQAYEAQINDSHRHSESQNENFKSDVITSNSDSNPSSSSSTSTNRLYVQQEAMSNETNEEGSTQG